MKARQKRVSQNLTVLCSALVFFTGCASFKEDAGFYPRLPGSAAKVADPWTGVALPGDISREQGFYVQFIPMPRQMPSGIAHDLLDPCYVYEFKAPRDTEWCDKFSKAGQPCPVTTKLRRVKFRAMVYEPTGQFLTEYSAVVNDVATGFLILFPPSEVNRLSGKSVVVVNSQGDTMVTARGDVFQISQENLETLPGNVLAQSPVGSLSPVSRMTEKGRQALAVIESNFPMRKSVYGNLFSVRATNEEEWQKILAFAPDDTSTSRVVSDGSAKIGTGGLPVLGTVLAVYQNYQIAKASCRNRLSNQSGGKRDERVHIEQSNSPW